MRHAGRVALAVAVAGALVMTPVAPVSAQPFEQPNPAATRELSQVEDSYGEEEPDRVAEPDRVLGAGWQDSSERAVVTSGDETGLHVLVADRQDAYQWRTVATLAEPTIESDQWIGQLCVTGSGRRAVVVYAPRVFTNHPVLMERGAFAAVVDLVSGEVTKLAERVSLAYYNPTCGAGETAALSRLEQPAAAGGPARTWIGTVDTTAATVGTEVRTDGQVTSVLPVGDRIVGVKGSALVEVDGAGEITVAASTAGQPFRLMADGPDGVAFQVARGDQVELARLVDGEVHPVATVPVGTVKLRPSAGGSVYALGVRATEQVGIGRLPATWWVADGLPDSTVSTGGRLLVERATTGKEAAGRLAPAPGHGRPQPIRIEAALLDDGQRGDEVAFVTHPTIQGAGQQQSPALAASAAPTTPDRPPSPNSDSNVPWDPDRACAVPRNDPTIQVYQPSPSQVEWAANLAVRGQLDFTRPADWLNNGLPAYSPQGMFPLKSLSGGGHVPAQVYLGILAQESNLWQASFHVVDALAGNPLTSSGFYGIHWDNQDPRLINWSEVDCGYGVAQVTTGMHVNDTGTVVNGVVMDYTKQKAVVLDYATNIAAGLRILQDKWNQTRGAGMIVNDGDPRYLENWWFAIWAYNSGFYPESERSQNNGAWGVGWSNNPASPLYPADRKMYLTAPLGADDEVGYDNAKHPNDWSYPERVIGFGYTSLRRYDFQTGAWAETYNVARSPGDPADAQPGRLAFCTMTVNQCDPNNETYRPGDHPDYPRTHCTRDDLRCWWNRPVTWEPACPSTCGTEIRRYTTVEPRPYANAIYDSRCNTNGLPANAVIIDDIDSSSPMGPQGCWRSWTRGGSFSLDFGSLTGSGEGKFPSKVDFHQIGGGFGGHFWFAHTRKENIEPWMRVTGRWTVDPVNAWARVFVHIPDHGAHTQQAFYEIHEPSGGAPKHRAITQHYLEHRWVDIGVFDFRGSGNPVIELSNFTQDGIGVHDVAWDAIAVQPLPRKPDHFVVAMGDSYDAGVGTFNYYPGSYHYLDDGGPGGYKNQCRRSPDTWSRQTVIPGAPASIGELVDGFSTNLDYHLVACAGARTHHMMGTEITFPGEPVRPNPLGNAPKGPENGRELTEIDRGFLDENTTLVTLHIGGNDAGWTDVLVTCFTHPACHLDSSMDDVVDLITGPVPDAVAVVMEQIARAAPNASIMLMGYPDLFDTAPACPGADISNGERTFINDLGALFAAHTVGDPDVYDPMNTGRSFGVDVTGAWFGPVCNPYIDYTGQGINGVRLRDPELGWDVKADGAFHPKTNGYYFYAQHAESALAADGYRW